MASNARRDDCTLSRLKQNKDMHAQSTIVSPYKRLFHYHPSDGATNVNKRVNVTHIKTGSTEQARQVVYYALRRSNGPQEMIIAGEVKW